MMVSYLVQLSRPVDGNRRSARNALRFTVLEQAFPDADAAVAFLAAPWCVAASEGRAIRFDDRPLSQGGGVTVLSSRQNRSK
jgi:hypothetical protein